MSDAVAEHLDWPEGLSTGGFLERYWQQKPLLLRQGYRGFINPLPADELAGLALEEDTTPRLVLRDADDRYHLEYGPFDASRFAGLGGSDWSLLVTDVEKHLPELAIWLAPFNFIPAWRFDDLMISYAPDGASVGAHVDAYDVFLLQASGQRRWSIDSRPDADHTTRSGGDLRLLERFEPDQSWVLDPGDVLYLPPGVPHHGVAVGEDCMTWSIGYRAPSAADALMRFTDRWSDDLEALRFGDARRRAALAGSRGEIDTESLAITARLWEQATTLTPQQLIELTGVLLTGGTGQSVREPSAAVGLPGPSPGDDPAQSEAVFGSHDRLRLHPFCCAAYVPRDDDPPGRPGEPMATLFIDGETCECSLAFARCVSEPGAYWRVQTISRADDRLLHERLIARGCVIRAA